MATNKPRYNTLICIAEQVLQQNDTGLLNATKTEAEDKSYNGKIAAFGVSIAMTGLLPTLANYYADKSSREVNTRNILTVIALMLNAADNMHLRDARALLQHAIGHPDDKQFKQDVIDCSIALKQVFRTYIER